jgi:hypothetical protein
LRSMLEKRSTSPPIRRVDHSFFGTISQASPE